MSPPRLGGRACIALLTTFSFVVLVVTGIVLYIEPHGRGQRVATAPGRGAVRSCAPGVVAALLAATVCCSGGAVFVDPGGGDGGVSPAEEPGCGHFGGEAGATLRFLRENAGRYHEAIARARAWLDQLRVDPAELRAAGIKSKKKLVELLDAYVRLHAIADLEERPEILARAWQVAAVTYTDGYHDMLVISDKHFKQDATSYLRAAYLMEGLGLDTTRFRTCSPYPGTAGRLGGVGSPGAAVGGLSRVARPPRRPRWPPGSRRWAGGRRSRPSVCWSGAAEPGRPACSRSSPG